MAAKARAKAAAAQAQASYAEREAEMIKAQAHIEAEATKKKAELTADLLKLRLQSAVAAATAEAEVLEEAAENETGEACFPSNSEEVFQHKPVLPPPANLLVDSPHAATLVPQANQQIKDDGEFFQNKGKENSAQSSAISEYE